MRETTALGYVMISAEDLAGWRTFGEECLGLRAGDGPGGETDRETLFFRADERSWRLGVERGSDGGLVALGFEVAGKESLNRMAEKLESHGCPVKWSSELAVQRGVRALIQTADPEGFALEFYYGGKIDQAQFVSPRGARFVTGEEGLGHAVIVVEDTVAADRFYAGLLEFRVSDVIASGPFELTFLSPNRRHHSLAYAVMPGTAPGTLQHIMLEVDDLDSVGRAFDRCVDAGVMMQTTIGKHTNDHVVSFYCTSPSGLTIEYGCYGRKVDDATHVTGFYDSASYWGHRPPSGAAHQAEESGR